MCLANIKFMKGDSDKSDIINSMKYFGTDGFRGKVNEELSVEHAFKIGKFLGYYYGKNNKKVRCIIGKDTRRSGYMFEYALTAGLCATGIDVYLMHVTTTPSISYIIREKGFNFGIMITASHNPYTDNGIKILDDSGIKFDDKILEQVEDYIDNKLEISLVKENKIGVVIDYSEGREDYIDYLVSATESSFYGLKVVLDCANGSASYIAPKVFEKLGADVFAINNTPNGYNINYHCGSTNIAGLQKYIKEQKMDIGFAFDGDADRCYAVDNMGRILDGDMILYILGCYMKNSGMLNDNVIVASIMTNVGIEKALNNQGISVIRTPVGDKYITKELCENEYSLGGEKSGHIILSEFCLTGDGILTAIKVLESILNQGDCLLKNNEEVLMYPHVERNVRMFDNTNILDDEEVKETIELVRQKLGANGRVVVRKSGTEPVIRVMIESEDEAECNDGVEDILKCIDKVQHR